MGAGLDNNKQYANAAEKKLYFFTKFAVGKYPPNPLSVYMVNIKARHGASPWHHRPQKDLRSCPQRRRRRLVPAVKSIVYY